MEQPFLPAEVSILVLRHLAGIGCNDTARCFFKELPSLKEFLQSKNRGNETPRAFEAPQVLGTLSDILYDYGKAKLIVKKLVVKLLNDWRALQEDSISPCDTLATQLRQISILIGTTFSAPAGSSHDSGRFAASPRKPTCDADTQTVTVIRTKRFVSTCTSLDIPESQNIVIKTVKATFDEETQTEFGPDREPEPPAPSGVEVDEVEQIPFMFYNHFLHNPDLQNTIAENITKHLDIRSEDKEDIVKTASSKTENEVDNFLALLLHGEENSQGGLSYSWNSQHRFLDENEQGEPDLLSSQSLDNYMQPVVDFNTPIGPSVLELQTPGKPVAQKLALKEVRAVEIVPKAVTPSQLPRNSRKGPQNIPKKVTYTSKTPTPISAWQQLGRRNIAPKIPTTSQNASVKTVEPLPIEPLPIEPLPPPIEIIVAPFEPRPNYSIQVQPTEDKPVPVSNSECNKPTTPCIENNFQAEPLSSITQNKAKDKMSPFVYGLIASAQKARQATTLDMHKKSYSTPRKKTHVRTLFITPPSLNKGGSECVTEKENSRNLGTLSQSIPLTRKRKPEQIDLQMLKSRRRLDMIDEQQKESVEQHHNADILEIADNPVRIRTGQEKNAETQKLRPNHPSQCKKDKDYSSTIEAVVQSSHDVMASMTSITNKLIQRRKLQNTSKIRTSPRKPKVVKGIVNELNVTKGKGKQGRSSTTPPSPPKQTSKRKSRQSEEDSALKTVADKAVPLGRLKTISPLRRLANSTIKNANSGNNELVNVHSKESSTTFPTSFLSQKYPNCSVLSKGALKEIRPIQSKSSVLSPHNTNPATSSNFSNQHSWQTISYSNGTVISKSVLDNENSLPQLPPTTSHSFPPLPPPIPQVFPPLTSTPDYRLPLSGTIDAHQPLREPPNHTVPPKSTQKPLQNQLPIPNNLSQVRPSLPSTPSPIVPNEPLQQVSVLRQGAPLNQQFLRVPSNSAFKVGRPSDPPPHPLTESSVRVHPPLPSLPVRSTSNTHTPLPKDTHPPTQSETDITQTQPLRVESPYSKASEMTAVVPMKRLNSCNTLSTITPGKIGDGNDAVENYLQAPPTPRFHMNFSGDSWDSGDGQITLNYEDNGIYPTNLLLSSPIGSGIPRTPGRRTPSSDEKSRSSCSIFDTPDVAYCKEQSRPDMGDLNTPSSKGSMDIPVPSPLSIQSKEINRSSNSKTTHQESCAVSSTSQEMTRSSEDRQSMPPPPVIGHQQRLPFNVAGRDKELTFSEQQTLFSLLELSSPNSKAAREPSTLPSTKEEDVRMNLLKNVNLEKFLARVHGGNK